MPTRSRGTISFRRRTATTVSSSMRPGGADFEFEFEACFLKPTGVNNAYKPLKVRYTDNDNLIAVNVDANNWNISKRVAGQDQQLQGYTGRGFADHDKIKIRCQGDRLRFFVNGVETNESATVNSGAGFDVANVPKAAFVAIGQPYDGGSSPVFPRVFAYSMAIYSLASDGLSVTPSVVTLNSTPGHQAIVVSGTFQGGVTQPQAMVMSSTGKVLQDWINIPVSGQTYAGTLPELDQLAEGDTAQVWVRDATLKSVTNKAPQYVKVQWHAMQADFGINAQGTAIYDRATIFSDMVKSASLGLTGSGIFFHEHLPGQHRAIRASHGHCGCVRERRRSRHRRLAHEGSSREPVARRYQSLPAVQRRRQRLLRPKTLARSMRHSRRTGTGRSMADPTAWSPTTTSRQVRRS